ncbi:MAG TPA: iron ABC transporter permease [Acidimicrobiales bacterium]|nr:iron ABC transporter permease [Acidimicrobiales bacterium]
MDRDRAALIRRIAWIAVGAVPAAFLAVFFAYPVASIIGRGLRGGGDTSVADVVTDPTLRRIAWFTVWQAALSALLALAVGLPAAWAIGRNDLPARRLVRALLIVPFVLPTVVVGAALNAVFERTGLDHGAFHLDGTIWAILLAHVIFNASVVVRVVGSYWAHLDPHAEEAARMLGASRLRVLREITLPRLEPALWAASTIAFLFCFTSFGVILIVGGPRRATLETEIWRNATQRTDFTTAAVLALVQLAAVVALLVVSTRAERRASAQFHTRRVVAPGRPRTLRRKLVVAGALGANGLLVAVPLGVLVERSLAVGDGHGLAHYRALAHRGNRSALFVPPLDAVWNSLVYATAAMVIAVFVGSLASVVVVHGRRGFGRTFDVGLMLPLGTSAVTLGFGILIALDEPPLDLRASRVIVPIVQALIGVPLVMRSLIPTLRAIDPRLRDAATVLGASPTRVRLEVDARAALRAVLIGAAFAFAISLGEFGATSFLARADAPTVPVAMFRLLGQPGAALRGQANALGVLLALMTVVAVLIIERLRPRDALGW